MGHPVDTESYKTYHDDFGIVVIVYALVIQDEDVDTRQGDETKNNANATNKDKLEAIL